MSPGRPRGGGGRGCSSGSVLQPAHHVSVSWRVSVQIRYFSRSCPKFENVIFLEVWFFPLTASSIIIFIWLDNYSFGCYSGLKYKFSLTDSWAVGSNFGKKYISLKKIIKSLPMTTSFKFLAKHLPLTISLTLKNTSPNPLRRNKTSMYSVLLSSTNSAPFSILSLKA